MQSKLLGISLFVLTAITITFYPAYQPTGSATTVEHKPRLSLPLVNPLSNVQPTLEVVFVLDTTGSMGGLLQAAKEKIWSIATTMASAEPAPQIKLGLVAFRDRGDDYVTQVTPLSTDLDSVYAQLMDLQAAGGGDGPESVNRALHDAVYAQPWSQDPHTYKVVFLVGDAPPHMDYQDEVQYPATLQVARSQSIAVNTIQCGTSAQTIEPWQQIAQLGNGQYLQVDQSGSAVAITTPFDRKLAELSEQMDATRMYYGTKAERVRQEEKLAATKKLHTQASMSSRARRAMFNSSSSGRENFLGEGELVEEVASGRVDLAHIDPGKLPASLQTMAPAQQRVIIAERVDKRNELKAKIASLAEQRAAYVEREMDKLGHTKDSLEDKIYRAVRAQASEKGIEYKADAPQY